MKYTSGVNKVLEHLDTKTAVFVIDMQWAFLTSIRHGLEGLIQNQGLVLDHASATNVPLLFIEYEYTDNSGATIREPTINELRRYSRPFSKQYTIKKSKPDAFEKSSFVVGKQDTDLIDVLDSLHIKKILMMGINSYACVFHTSKSAIDNGFSIITSPRLISGKSRKQHKSYLSWYKKNATYIN